MKCLESVDVRPVNNLLGIRSDLNLAVPLIELCLGINHKFNKIFFECKPSCSGHGTSVEMYGVRVWWSPERISLILGEGLHSLSSF